MQPSARADSACDDAEGEESRGVAGIEPAQIPKPEAATRFSVSSAAKHDVGA